jgi:hypothetical protein
MLRIIDRHINLKQQAAHKTMLQIQRYVCASCGIRSPDRPACSESLYRLSYPCLKIDDEEKYVYVFRVKEVTDIRLGLCMLQS